jgi:hypothetical protein
MGQGESFEREGVFSITGSPWQLPISENPNRKQRKHRILKIDLFGIFLSPF